MRALEARSRQTSEPVAHIVMAALADSLEIDHSTLFQVSTSTALVEGVYGGVVTIGELKRHGSFDRSRRRNAGPRWPLLPGAWRRQRTRSQGRRQDALCRGHRVPRGTRV